MTKDVPYEDNMEEWNEKYGILRANWISQLLPKAGKLLDIAGYHGDLKRFLPKEVDYYLIDLFAPEMKNSVKFDLNLLNYKILPFADQTFDIVVALDIFEHIKRPFELLEEIRRILKDDGLFITSRHMVPTARHYITIEEVFFEDWKIEGRMPMAEGTFIEGDKVKTTLFHCNAPSEIFYKMRKA